MEGAEVPSCFACLLGIVKIQSAEEVDDGVILPLLEWR